MLMYADENITNLIKRGNLFLREVPTFQDSETPLYRFSHKSNPPHLHMKIYYNSSLVTCFLFRFH